MQQELGLSGEAMEDLLIGRMSVTVELARRLARTVGSSVEFWVTRDGHYRDDLLRGESEAWVDALPLSQMVSLGWVEQGHDWRSRLHNCLGFFGVSDLQSWAARYSDILSATSFRASESQAANPAAVAAWIRRGETQVADIRCKPWDPTRFVECLDEVRGLTLQKDPEVFLPELVSICRRAGVAVTAVRPLGGSPVSGVARFVSEDRALILLSGRYLSDDHLWFTFFHEAGHLILHDPSRTFVDSLDRRLTDEMGTPSDEAEANKFAQDRLVPRDELASLSTQHLSMMTVVRASRRLNVAPGVVVGQLQHAGVVSFKRLNGLKRRYKWTGSTLGKA